MPWFFPDLITNHDPMGWSPKCGVKTLPTGSSQRRRWRWLPRWCRAGVSFPGGSVPTDVVVGFSFHDRQSELVLYQRRGGFGRGGVGVNDPIHLWRIHPFLDGFCGEITMLRFLSLRVLFLLVRIHGLVYYPDHILHVSESWKIPSSKQSTRCPATEVRLTWLQVLLVLVNLVPLNCCSLPRWHLHNHISCYCHMDILNILMDAHILDFHKDLW